MKKKSMRKLLTMALSVIMLVSMLPLAAMAADYPTYVHQDLFPDADQKFNDFNARDYFGKPEEIKHKDKITVDIDDYERYVVLGDQFYEFVGMASPASPKHGNKKIANGVEKMEIPPCPTSGDPAEVSKWMQEYYHITLAYVPHEHDLKDAPWHFDNNYHWKYCNKCKCRAFLSWHSDVDENGICDFCGNEIHYYNITVKDAEGGKVTLSKEKGEMNDTIKVTVTPDAGYHLDTIRFFNNNAKHSQLTRWEDKKGAEYHFVILNWDVEVEPVFVKD